MRLILSCVFSLILCEKNMEKKIGYFSVGLTLAPIIYKEHISIIIISEVYEDFETCW